MADDAAGAEALGAAAPGSLLPELARLAILLEAGEIADRARSLARRLVEGRFYVACIGQFKRGSRRSSTRSSTTPFCRPGSFP